MVNSHLRVMRPKGDDTFTVLSLPVDRTASFGSLCTSLMVLTDLSQFSPVMINFVPSPDLSRSTGSYRSIPSLL